MRASRNVLWAGRDTRVANLIEQCKPANALLCWLATLFGESRIITHGKGLLVVGYWWRGELWITSLEDNRSLEQWLQEKRDSDAERLARCALWVVAAGLWAVLLVY